MRRSTVCSPTRKQRYGGRYYQPVHKMLETCLVRATSKQRRKDKQMRKKKPFTQYACGMPQVTSAAADRPKPVYKSTACQLGIHKTAGVWSLLDVLVPPAPTSLLVRRWLRRLLLLPPPTHVANSIRSACQLLSGQHPHTQPVSHT